MYVIVLNLFLCSRTGEKRLSKELDSLQCALLDALCIVDKRFSLYATDGIPELSADVINALRSLSDAQVDLCQTYEVRSDPS